MRILVIEDELKIARAVAEGLSGAGYDAVTSPSGEDGYFRLNSEAFDLVILDWMLPGRDGLEILAALRAQGRQTPVLLLTARDAVEDRVRGLESGADDYLVKPFAFPELLARVRALLRRAPAAPQHLHQVADLELNAMDRTVLLQGREVSLTAREFDLLRYLMVRAGTVVSREMLARDVWQEAGRATPLDNVIDVHMARLRKKIDANSGEGRIETLRGVGFRLRSDG